MNYVSICQAASCGILMNMMLMGITSQKEHWGMPEKYDTHVQTIYDTAWGSGVF